MKEKRFTSNIRNYFLLIILPTLFIILLFFLFGPGIWKSLGYSLNFENYLKILSPILTFVSIVVTGTIAIYVMNKNHKNNIGIMNENHKHELELINKNLQNTLKIEDNKNKNMNELSTRIIMRYLLRIRKLAEGYKDQLITTNDYIKITKKQIYHDIQYIIDLLDECIKQPFIIDSDNEKVTTRTINIIYVDVRNIEMNLKQAKSFASIDYKMIEKNQEKFKNIIKSIDSFAHELDFEITD